MHEFFLYHLFLVLLVATAAISILFKNLINAIICLSIFNLAMVIIFILLQAPDVAMAEAIIGLGVTTALYIVTISKTRENEE